MNFDLKYVFYVGLVMQNGQDIEKEFALSTIYNCLNNVGIDGYNVQETTGYYKGKEEKSLVITAFDTGGVTGGGKPYAIAKALAQGLYQECVLVEVTQNVVSELVFS